MDRAEIVRRVIAFLKESYPHQGLELTSSMDLMNEWFVDSIGIVLTVAFLEEEFHIEVKGTDVNAKYFKNVDALADFVIERMGSK